MFDFLFTWQFLVGILLLALAIYFVFVRPKKKAVQFTQSAEKQAGKIKKDKK